MFSCPPSPVAEFFWIVFNSGLKWRKKVEVKDA